MRLALAALMALLAAAPATAADPFHREDLRIAMAAAGPRGLEAMLIRPSGTRRYPLALLSHGTPREAAAREGMTPNGLYVQAIEFARRGFAAVVVMRRGYGDSGGGYAESNGPCDRRNYLASANASAADLRAAVDAMSRRTDVTTQGMIAAGVSAGGFASIALSADPPPGLAAVISFAGGRGSRADDDVCDEDALVRAFASLGKTSRIPSLWVYAGNDKYFGPDLARRMHVAFTTAGGRARFIDAPAFGRDGHGLFSAMGVSVWTPMVDGFLREMNLGTRDLIAAPATAAVPPPRQFSEKGRAAFTAYLASGAHKAFAVSPKGQYAFRSGLRTPGLAEAAALAECAKHAPDCALYATGDELAGQGNR
ncbi:S9 family peptidase [Bradyrhizobium sp.]|uniref:alpha/beta hydrolase family protein n=1 Tax=Bradyrhizobium sp. TaxID=376 RepID=UPI0027210CF3|nr:CocE/NonD family hydrolase [Bradyrhizobium sp.]MDO9296957.1 CocE/NonD family hydrolase [Bradyrhizobium sp.]